MPEKKTARYLTKWTLKSSPLGLSIGHIYRLAVRLAIITFLQIRKSINGRPTRLILRNSEFNLTRLDFDLLAYQPRYAGHCLARYAMSLNS